MASIPSIQATIQEQHEESATLINLNYGFYQCPDAVLNAKGLSWRAKCIYCRLLCYAREKETCFPGHARLAVDLGKSIDTIQRGLRELRDYGLITWKRRGLTKTNVYVIVKLTEVNGLKNDLSLKPHICRDKKPQERGNQKPQNCGTNEMQSKHTQVEANEVLSNSSKGIVESIRSCSQIAPATIRKTEGETKEGSTLSIPQDTDTTQHTNPTPPNRAEQSKTEAPPAKERPARRLLAAGMSSTAEIMGKDKALRPNRTPEPPRMAAPPLTQEDMDKRIRERIARERATMQASPLADIIPPEHWQELEAKNPTQPVTHCKSRRQPVSEKLQIAIERISEEMGDWEHVTANITQAENIRREAGADREQFIVHLYDARAATKHAQITKCKANGATNKMPYFFACLRSGLSLPKKPH